jgi:hypothetical protein
MDKDKTHANQDGDNRFPEHGDLPLH